MLIDKIKKADNEISLLSKLPQDYLEKIQLEMPAHLRELLSNVITVLLKRVNMPDDEINEITGRIQEKGVEEMFAGWDNYDIQETRRIAKEEGREEGAEKERFNAREEKRQMIIGMKNEGFDDVVIAKIIKLPIEEIKEICSVNA